MASTDLHHRAPDVNRSTERLTWLLIAAACVVPAVLAVLQQYVQARIGRQAATWQDLTFAGADWLFLGALAPIAYYLGRQFPLAKGRWKRTLAIHILGALLLCIGWASLGIFLGLLLHHFPAEGPLGRAYLSWIFISLPWSVFVYFTLLGCMYAFSYFVEARERDAHASRLAAQLAEARLSALRTQLNPHFLFNSLNALSVLVREQNTAGASQMLELLSDVLRQVLRTDQPHEIPLRDEVRFLEQYLGIEQVRFSDRLHVQWSIDGPALAALVPGFVLQPLVENAIKHGIAKRAEAGAIVISARIIGTYLEISIRDDGVGMDASSQPEGVGLSNTRERLRALYGDAATVTIHTPPNGGTQVTLKIPFHTRTNE
jgi:two-component system LytT family sensor kinase